LSEHRVLRVQRRPNPGFAYLRQCGLLLDGVGLQVASKSCCRRQYTTHPWQANGGYQRMIRWVGDGHASSDVHADDVGLRINSALSERRGSKVAGD